MCIDLLLDAVFIHELLLVAAPEIKHLLAYGYTAKELALYHVVKHTEFESMDMEAWKILALIY